jgi:hypothetical protein
MTPINGPHTAEATTAARDVSTGNASTKLEVALPSKMRNKRRVGGMGAHQLHIAAAYS